MSHLHAVTDSDAADLEAQDAALDADCPSCHAKRDAYCVNPLTGQQLHRNVSHWQRIPKNRPTTGDPA